jgi:hypothetical protein
MKRGLAGMMVVTLSAGGTPLPLPAAVDSSPSDGFVVNLETTVAATPDAAYGAFVSRIGAWWDPEHTFSGKVGRMTVDARAGGCFCEALDDGGSVLHGEIVYLQPGRVVRFASQLGPLQAMPVVGVLTFTFEAAGDAAAAGTRVKLEYRVHGGFTMDRVELAGLVDTVLAQQLARFTRFVASGRPEP